MPMSQEVKVNGFVSPNNYNNVIVVKKKYFSHTVLIYMDLNKQLQNFQINRHKPYKIENIVKCEELEFPNVSLSIKKNNVYMSEISILKILINS